jgi:DNA-binding transcriptional MerR regulator
MTLVVRSVRGRDYGARMQEHRPPEKSDPGYSTTQAARIAKLTKRRVIYLREQNLVVPSLTRGGSRRYYSFMDLIELTTIASLTAADSRISISRVRAVVEALRKFSDRPLVNCSLAVCDGQVLWADEHSRTLIDVTRGFQTTLVVNLDLIETGVRRALVQEHGTHPDAKERRAA